MSKQANLGRPWTPYEDRLLTDAIRIHGENTESWKTIALSVPGRTNKACRKRWLHSLSPTVKKCAWTQEEDQLLLSLFEKHPNKWSQIARGIPGRTDDACSKRYREALDPNLKKDDWSDEEDRQLLEILARYGMTKPKWGLIGQELRRSGLGCRNRWRLLERKKCAAARQISQPHTEGVAADSRLLADVWPLFTEEDTSTYWNPPWDPLDFVAPDARNSDGSGLDMMILDVGHMQSSGSTTSINTEMDGTHRIIIQNTDTDSHARTADSFSCCPSSLSTALSDLRAEDEATQTIAETPDEHEQVTYSPIPLTPDFANFGQVQDDQAQCNTRTSHITPPHDNSQLNKDSFDVPNASADDNQSASGDTLNVDREQSELLAYPATSHFSPVVNPVPYVCSPSSEPPAIEGTQRAVSGLLLPRKRRRSAATCPTYLGVRIDSIKVGKQKAAPTLSSTLPVSSDSSVLAYTCGHADCWPAGSSASKEGFSTSGELYNHFKDQHMDDLRSCDDTPFRCGLSGCSRGWKSINGLQYHLQISKVHYQSVFSTVKKKPVDEPGSPTSAAAVTDSPRPSDDSFSKPKRKPHKCPHASCSKEYKQLNGLRYHLLHGHPKKLPVQLGGVPPAIAKRLGVDAEMNSLPS
ncbi:hypothetical protein DFH11DRAFT_80368 [Phellopilus nigrolimitatus]|nr:hypothetical protein DFH11DRAFT_80368 [Phellopilus nigrolimitatus]